MKTHSLADLFPLIEGSEFEALVQDIKKNGLLDPIIIFEEKILDGRNRWNACKKAGIEPKTKEYNGNDPLGFVISHNLKRRHLNESQRAVIAEKIATMKQGTRTDLQPSANLPEVSQLKAAKTLNVSERSIRDVRAIKRDAPEKIKEIESGKKTIHRAKKEIKAEQNERELKTASKKITTEGKSDLSKVCTIQHCSMKSLLTSGIKPDCIITDPPYPEKFLPVYAELAEYSREIPLVAVMIGQSYLPEILSSMCLFLKYRWMLAYLTPGGQAVQLWQAKVNTFWKPILLFGKSSEWIGDVCRSDVNDNDKRFHDWGQSESGMADLIERLTKPGQLICDPFLGGGTTALVSLRLGRRFIGCDMDESACKKSIQRCEAFYASDR